MKRFLQLGMLCLCANVMAEDAGSWKDYLWPVNACIETCTEWVSNQSSGNKAAVGILGTYGVYKAVTTPERDPFNFRNALSVAAGFLGYYATAGSCDAGMTNFLATCCGVATKVALDNLCRHNFSATISFSALDENRKWIDIEWAELGTNNWKQRVYAKKDREGLVKAIENDQGIPAPIKRDALRKINSSADIDTSYDVRYTCYSGLTD